MLILVCSGIHSHHIQYTQKPTHMRERFAIFSEYGFILWMNEQILK